VTSEEDLTTPDEPRPPTDPCPTPDQQDGAGADQDTE
jgi:hypothetical protein